MTGVFLALISALVWGSADFCGGLATRRDRPFPVTTAAAFSGMVLMIAIAWLRGERLVGWQNTAWSLAAGVFGVLGIAALYRGLSVGNASIVAPTAAVVGAVIPLIVGVFQDGWPGASQTTGLSVGLAGIWLVSLSGGPGQPAKQDGLWAAILAGALFGGFFVSIAQVEHGLIFGPLALAKATEVGLGFVILKMQGDRLPPLSRSPIALLAGILDAGGNVFYLLARQYTRMDVAAILASMYPASTVLLSALLTHEKIGRAQWAGLLLCLLALALIAA